MRKIIILLFLLFVPFAFAAKTETTKALNINDTAAVYGKALTVLSASPSGQLKVSVDGVEGIARPGANRTTNINEMLIEILNFTYVDKENIEAILELTVYFECGDKACNLSETSISCCTDCGCKENLKCINNICQKEECVLDWDCEDNNSCTTDKCSTTRPRTCSNTMIVQCVSNDSCCPSTCGPQNDADCASVGEKKEEKAAEEKPGVAEKPEEAVEPKKEAVISERERGILIMAGIALLVVAVGFFVFARKQ